MKNLLDFWNNELMRPANMCLITIWESVSIAINYLIFLELKETHTDEKPIGFLEYCDYEVNKYLLKKKIVKV